MPVSPENGARLAATVVATYERVELLLLERLARATARGVLGPVGLAEQVNAQQELAAAGRLLVARLAEQVEAQATDAVQGAAGLGAASARGDLTAELVKVLDARPDVVPGGRAVVKLTEDLLGALRSTHGPILRQVDDVYRQVVAQAAPDVLLGALTRRQAAQTVLDDMARRGLSGFTDRRGRRWEAATYAEAATRGATANAAVAGHLDVLAEVGLDLVQVSDAPQECKLCRPWEGKVLDRSVGGRRTQQMQSVTDGRVVTLEVAGSLAEAKRAGFLHPGCRHSVSAYLPGATKPLTDTEDVQGDKDRQRLRALERHVRAAKRREAVALDDGAKRLAQTDVRLWQREIRQHVETTSAKRQPARERVGVAR